MNLQLKYQQDKDGVKYAPITVPQAVRWSNGDNLDDKLSEKANKVDNPTSGNFAAVDANGNIVDSGHKHSDYLTQHQSLANYIQKSNTSGLVKNDGTIDTNTYLTQHQDISGKADKVSSPTSGDLAGLDANGNPTDSGITATSVSTAVTNSHTHSNKTVLDYVPSSLGTAGQALCVNSGGTGLEFATVQGGGGLTNYDFTPLSTPTISSNATTITFAANQRNCVELSTNSGSDLSIALISNNQSDNYIWITNSHGSADIDVIFSSIKFGTTTINDVKGTDSLSSIGHGETLEIGVYVSDSKARITSRIL